jgi:hypothetical protein
MEGGDLHHLWQPYELYARVDYVYAAHTFAKKEPFPIVVALGSVVENGINLYALYKDWSNAPSSLPIAMIALSMTFWKTVIYFAMDFVSGFQNTGHNDGYTWTMLYLIPNGIWILVPLMLLVKLIRQLTVALGSMSYKKTQ